jgi:hypothetical protein
VVRRASSGFCDSISVAQVDARSGLALVHHQQVHHAAEPGLHQMAIAGQFVGAHVEPLQFPQHGGDAGVGRLRRRERRQFGMRQRDAGEQFTVAGEQRTEERAHGGDDGGGGGHGGVPLGLQAVRQA